LKGEKEYAGCYEQGECSPAQSQREKVRGTEAPYSSQQAEEHQKELQKVAGQGLKGASHEQV